VALPQKIGTAVVLAIGALLVIAPSAPASEFFKGDFETGDLSQWSFVQAIPGRVTTVKEPVSQGTYSGRFEVREGDKESGTGKPRAVAFSGQTFKEGDVRYFRILSRVDSWDFGNWGIIWQIQDQSGGSPPLSLQIYKNKNTPMLWLGPGSGPGEYWEAPMPELGNWFEVVIRVEFGTKGSLKVWLNGKSQEMLNKETTYKEINTLGKAPGEDMLGINRSSSATTPAVVYDDDYRITDEFFSEPPEPQPLFKGDFETGNLSQWPLVQAIPGRATVVKSPVSQGTYSGRFEVREGDKEPATGSQRAEVISGQEFEEGDVRYFRILSRVDSWDFGHWGMIWQVHDESSGSPPLSLQLYKNKSGSMLWLGPGDASAEYWEAPLPGLEKWFEVVIRVDFGAKGSLKVWLNGKPQEMLNKELTYSGIDTLGKAPGYDKLGIYRSSVSTTTAVVYHDDYRVSDEFFSDPP
jgi:hypothetical protein